MITIKHLDKTRLLEFIYSQEYIDLEFVPITRHRALSHIRNPSAKADDTLLFLAYEGAQLAGYIGVLPDTIYYNGHSESCGWLSCLWVDNRFRGKKIAYKLLQHCIDEWNAKLLLTEFTGPAGKLYDKLGIFEILEAKSGVRLYIRSDLAKLLAPKSKVFENGKGMLNFLDVVINSVLDLRFFTYSNNINKYQLEYVNHIDEEIDLFIKDKQEKQLFQRRSEELNWIIKNPWVLTAPEGDRYEHRYYFSSIDRSFDFIPVKVYDKKNRLIAFLLFAKRNSSLKLPYLYFSDSVETVIDVINYHIVRWRIKTFTTFNTSLVGLIRKRPSPAIFMRGLKREYRIGSTLNLKQIDEKFEIQDGDGDSSFT